MSGLVEGKKGAKGRGRASVIDHGPWLEGTCWKSEGGATEERWGTSDLWTTAYSSTYSKPPSSNTSFEFDKELCLLINTQQHARMVCYPSCNLKLKKKGGGEHHDFLLKADAEMILLRDNLNPSAIRFGNRNTSSFKDNSTTNVLPPDLLSIINNR